MELYTPVLALAALAAGFAIFSIASARSRVPPAPTAPSWTPTSAASSPRPQPVGGGRFPVRYYITAMMFIIFDIEIVFLYPIAVAFDQMALFGLIEMVLFIIPVFVAYTYVWKRGGLEWD